MELILGHSEEADRLVIAVAFFLERLPFGSDRKDTSNFVIFR